MIGYGISLGGIIWVYWTDILPTDGVSFCITINYAFATIMSFIFQKENPKSISRENFIIGACFFLVVSIFSNMFVELMIIETKSKS